MKNSILLIITISICLSVTAQDQYKTLIHQADSLYDVNQYKESAQKYSAAFSSFGGKGYYSDRYNAACSWALANEPDSAFVQLFKIAKKGNYTNLDHIIVDEDLGSLYTDERWDEVIAIVKANKNEAEKNLDKPLTAALDSIYNEDQTYRLKSRDISQKYGRDSDEYQSLWDTIHVKDSTNLIFVTNLIEERGWLGTDVIGEQGNSTLFLVIQHSNTEIWERYLPVVRDAVKKGNATGSQLALLEDRAALARGERQIYGSQLTGLPNSSEFAVSPLIDPDNVDKRRAKVGLSTMQEYVRYWDLTWNLKEYKKNLPDLEKLLIEAGYWRNKQ
jgi:hypothetical protein